ncbi:hypothetical protein V6N13_116817 [Hibiscus sabdariffa]
MVPKGTCRGRSTRVGQVVRAALKRNFHRAAGRILCRRLKYAMGYCKWQSGLAATIQLRFSPLSLRFVPPPVFTSLFTRSASGVQHWMYSSNTCENIPTTTFPMYIASLTIQSSAIPTRASPMPCKKNLSVNSYNGPLGVGQH